MTQFDRFERELPVALGDVAGTGAPDYLTDILGRTARTRQRPAWASLERWLPMDLTTPRAATARIPWRAMGVLALIAILMAAAIALYAGSQRHVPPPFGPAVNGLIPLEGNGDIFVGDPVTGTTRLVVGGPGNDNSAFFSPDGTQIGFFRDMPTGEDIYVARTDGSDVRKITSAPLAGLTTWGWTPNSDGLLVGYYVNSVPRLEVLDAAGKAAPRLLAEDLEADSTVYRPPNGDEIMIRGKVDGVWGLYAMDTDGSNIRLLAAAKQEGPPEQDLTFPAYSPDGTRIYYNRYTPEAETIQAWIMNADGSGQHRFNSSGPSCCWREGGLTPSPDGQSVAMWRRPVSEDGLITTGNGLITLYPADGSGDGRVIGPEFTEPAHWVWAPDSTSVLVKPDVADGGPVLVNPDDGSVAPPPWSSTAEPSDWLDWQRLAR